jgi:hypothetical protein
MRLAFLAAYDGWDAKDATSADYSGKILPKIF